jgi:hypothetical protein
MAKNENLKPLPPEKTPKAPYSPTGTEGKVWAEYLRRKRELIDSRKNVQGENLDDLMRRVDRNYFNRVADIPASELDVDQKPISICNAFGKVQSALSILVDRNPEIVLNESLKHHGRILIR